MSQPWRRAYKASYNRPLIARGYRAINMPLATEMPLIRFLESNGYSVSYSTSVDSARRGAEIMEHKLFISVGHDEYWSKLQRDAITRARDVGGVSLAFMSGNEAYWKVRWESSTVVDDADAAAAADADADADASAWRTMVVYKDSQSLVALDPVEWTGTWRDGRAINPEGAQPENAVTGQSLTTLSRPSYR